MPITPQLIDLARQRQPVYYSDPSMPWEERLARAYDEASAALAGALPPGKKLDGPSSVIASEQVEADIAAFSPAYETCLLDQVDLPEDIATKLPSERARDFMLGRFQRACDGLGAYLTGYARSMVNSGEMSGDMFEQDAESRLRMLSDVIHAHRTGTLVSAVTPEDSVVLASRKLEVRPTSGLVFIRSAGVQVTLDPPSIGQAGLGSPALIAGAVVVAAVAAVAMVAGVVYLMGARTQALSEARARAMQACERASSSGHPDAAEICRNLGDVTGTGDSLSNLLLPDDVLKGLGKSAVPWVAAGVGLLTLIAFAPQIAQSMASGWGSWQAERQRQVQLNRLRGQWGA